MKFEIKRTVDPLGRIVIPKQMRTHYAIDTGNDVVIIPAEDGIFIKKAKKEKSPKRQKSKATSTPNP